MKFCAIGTTIVGLIPDRIGPTIKSIKAARDELVRDEVFSANNINSIVWKELTFELKGQKP